MNFFRKHHRFLFYSAWLVLALAQSASTELIADEAYYWVYSKFPAWGYFDHPPMIAVLIKTSYAIFHNELGVRLLCALLSTFTIATTESLTERKNPFLFYAIVLSIAVLQLAGFFAVPDTPLLFFTALFFYTYRLFVKDTNWKNALLLAISIGLLFYTKYHGILIVFFTILSNIKILARWQLWFAALLVLIFYSPHLYWQWQHDWISFRYHLFESNVNPYRFSHTTDYLLGQLLLAGPIAGLLLLPAAFIYKPKSSLEKALKFTLIGIYSVFLLSSFRGKVEANWTMPALIPIIVLSHQFIIDKISWIRPLRIIAFLSLLIIIAGRLYLVLDIGPDNSFKGRFHNNKSWAAAIKEKTGNTPVVFYNSYQRASLYWFYSGVQSHSHNAYWERRSNYNFWPTESSLLGKTVYLADVYSLNNLSDSVNTVKGTVGISLDTMYFALGGVQIKPLTNKLEIGQSKTILLKSNWKIPYDYFRFMDAIPAPRTELYAGVFKGKELTREIRTDVTTTTLMRHGQFDLSLDFDLSMSFENIPAGKYDLRFGIKSKDYLATHNSETIELIIH